jgi:hypothetical protein
VKLSPAALLLWLIAALLLLLAWMTVTGRLGDSRHGYAALKARVTNPLDPPFRKGES